MRIRSRITLCLATLLCVFPAFANLSNAADAVRHRLAIHVDQNDPAVMNLTLNNVANVVQHYSAAGEEVDTSYLDGGV